MRQLITCLLLCIASFEARLSAQIGGPCQPGALGTPYCDQACVRCKFDPIDDATFAPLPLSQPYNLDLCAFGSPPVTIENPRWYAFIAGSEFIEFGIKSSGCKNNTGLEAAIMSLCDWPFAVNNCGPLSPTNTIQGLGLTVGQMYYLVVDGISADQCKFHIQVNFGSVQAPELGAMSPIKGLQNVCPKAKVTYSIPPVDYALSYTWIAPPGSKINGGTNVLTQKSAQPVEIEFGTTGGTLCVTASNVCDTPKTSCITITNKPLAITQLPDLELCYEQLPFFWEEEPGYFVSSPGTYTFTSTPYSSYLGCDSIVRQKIKALPRKAKTLPPTWLCQGECLKVGDFDYCESGTFQEILTAFNGCDSTINFTIIKIPVRAGVKAPDTITCRRPTVVLYKDSTTTKANTVTYKWVNSQGVVVSTADTAVVNSAGPYYFIVTNHGGGRACPDTAEVNVPVNTTPPLANAGPPKVLNCEQPQVQLQGSGSTGSQYTYLWVALNGGNIVSGANTLAPLVNAPGTYRLRVTNLVNGCTSTASTTVTAQNLPPAVSANGGTFTCADPNVILQVNTDATSPSFAWTGPGGFSSTQANPTAGVAGDYTVVVTDSVTGCTSTAVAAVVANTNPPGATAIGGTLTCVTTSVQLGGASPANNPTFAWTGPNGFTANVANPNVSEAGTYTLTVTGPNGCTSTASATVPLDNIPPGASLAVGANLNCNNSAVNITASSSGPAGSLQHIWTRPDGSSTSTGAVPLLSAGAPGVYTVVITNTENGCTSQATASVAQTPAVTAGIASVSNVLCNGQQNGSATASAGGGNGTYTYAWNNGGNAATNPNLGSGTYTVTITDGENCTATASATVSQPTVLAANTTATPQMTNGASDGTATANPVGGTPGYTYHWSNNENTQTVTGLAPGAYTVTVTDKNGCTAIAIATVNAYDCTIDAVVEASPTRCFGSHDGQAGVTVLSGQAPYTYQWSSGGTMATEGNLAPGTYTVVVTDAANCPETILFTITEPTAVKANATATNMSGPATSDGTASAGPTGGTGTYTYLWNNGEMTAAITGLPAGLYTVTVTDANGCTATQTVEVLAGNCGISSGFIATPAVCHGQANGTATVVLNGGTGPFTYAWSSGGTGATESNLAAGTYTVTVVDANNCDITDEVTISEPTALAMDLVESNNTACPTLPDGSATVTAGGGTPPLTIAWDNGQSGPTATGLIAGTYTAVATDKNDCTIALQVVIEAIDTIAPQVLNDSLVGELGVAGNITLSVQSIGLEVTDNCGVQSVSFAPTGFNCAQLGPHPVVVTSRDEAGNIAVDTIIVTVVDDLPPTLVCPASIIRCFGQNVVQYPAPVATDNCLGNGGTFDLVSGLPSGAYFPQGTTTNTYTYTDADGNVGACTFEVTILDDFTVSGAVTNDIDNQKIGAIDLTVNGSLSPYTFKWYQNGNLIATTEDLSNIGAGEYVVVITDEIGCTATSDTFRVSSLVNTNEPDWAAQLRIVPNPTSGNLSVYFPDQLQEEVHLTVFDLTGRRVHEQNAQAPNRVDFDLSALPEGMYSMLIRINRQVIARKIVVAR